MGDNRIRCGKYAYTEPGPGVNIQNVQMMCKAQIAHEAAGSLTLKEELQASQPVSNWD